MKKSSLFFIFIFLISLASASRLSMSPPQIDFNENNLCQEVIINTDEGYNLSGRILFAEEDYSQRKLSAHKYPPEEIGINMDYPNNLSLDGIKKISICIEPKKGNYHGVLLYRIEGKPVEVGIWINSSFKKKGILSLTGNVISQKEKSNSVYVLTIVLAVLLLVALLIKRRHN